MANGYLGLDIADNKIRYVYLEKDKNHYCVLNAGSYATTLNLHKESSLHTAIHNILRQEQIAPQRVFVSLSRRDTIIHQAVLPKMKDTELEQVVCGEIEKIPDFYNQQYEYIFHNYPTQRGRFLTIFAAVTRSFLSFLFSELQKTKLIFKHLEITPLNLKELLPLIKKDNERSSKNIHKGRQQQENINTCETILVIHDQQSYLCFCKGNQYELIYKLPLGLEPLIAAATEAERDSIIQNWTGELRRAIKSYLLQKKGTDISCLWLVWDQKAVPKLDTHIKESLELNVEIVHWEKISNIIVKEDQHINPIYAVALTPIIAQINRLPVNFPLNHFSRGFYIKEYFTKIALVSIMILVGLSAIFTTYNARIYKQANILNQETKETTQYINDLKIEALHLYQKQEQYLSMQKRLLTQATFVQRLNRVSWSQVFSVIAQELPDELALTLFKFSEDGSARINGQALNMESIAELIRRIEDSAILKKGKFDFLKEKKEQNQKKLEFGIFAKLKSLDKENDNQKQD